MGINKVFVISFPYIFFRNKAWRLKKKRKKKSNFVKVLGIDVLNGPLTVLALSPNELIQQVWPFHVTKMEQKA